MLEPTKKVCFDSEKFLRIMEERRLRYENFAISNNQTHLSVATVRKAVKEGECTNKTVRSLARWLGIEPEELILA